MRFAPHTLPLVLATAATVAWVPAPVAAQDDVEARGLVHGTRPPAAYYELKARNPDAFTFGRAWKARNPALRRVPGAVRSDGAPVYAPRPRARDGDEGRGLPGLLRAAEGPDDVAQVEGTFHLPLVLGLYADSPPDPPFTTERMQAEFFDGPNSRHATVEEYFDAVSGGRVDFQGMTLPWVRTTLTEAQVTGSTQGLGGDAQVGHFIVQILTGLEGTVDWGLFDNDGPDGVPNSGDDDGYVDVLAVIQPRWGGECGGGADRLWSHKWRLDGDGGGGAWGAPYVTTSPAAGGGFIRIDDYAIQPARSCDEVSINQIGTLAHELGHGFGLPDLYATNGQGQGIGQWGLMGSGSWGCAGYAPERPCMMSAWSRAILGWAQVETLPPGEDLGTVTLDPAASGGRVLRMDVESSPGEYYLLENRQPQGFDQTVAAPGLLVWHVNDNVLADRWRANAVNNLPSRLGVGLRQADGRNDLGAGANRADGGDPFPGTTGNDWFHASSAPASRTHDGEPSGLTLLDIAAPGPRVTFRALTRFQDLTVRAEGDEGEATVVLDGEAVPALGLTVPSAPWQIHRLEASGGVPLGEGRRTGFQAWDDAPDADRSRVFVTGLEDAELVARYGVPEVRLRVSVADHPSGVEPGGVTTTPATPEEADGRWYPEGTTVALLADPEPGFGFDAWEGAVAGQPNPATLTLDEPAEVGVSFRVTYAVPDRVESAMEAGRPQTVQLEAVDGREPIVWSVQSGSLPQGLTLHLDGVLRGTPLETGRFPLTVLARDASGLEATGELVVEVAVPALSTDALTARFFLRAEGLTSGERAYLDAQGNQNQVYDLGDLRSYLLVAPPEAAAPGSAASSLEPREASPTRVTVVHFGAGGGS